QVVERRGRPFDERAAVERRLDTARRAIEQTDAKCQLHSGNRLRHSRLRQCELCRSLSHAAGLRDEIENAQVAQPKPPQRALAEDGFEAHSRRLWLDETIELLEYGHPR